MNLNEDNNGFIEFPINKGYNIDNYKTLVYIIAYDENYKYVLSNIKTEINSVVLIDDIDNYIEKIPDYLVSCVCIGWIEFCFKKENDYWYANFNNLTHQGRNLYYSLKKLHNNKEIRLITSVIK